MLSLCCPQLTELEGALERFAVKGGVQSASSLLKVKRNSLKKLLKIEIRQNTNDTVCCMLGNSKYCDSPSGSSELDHTSAAS